MKKILVSTLTLSMVLLCFSCSPNNKPVNVTDIAKQYGYYIPFQVCWGMSKEECIKSLDVNSKDIQFTKKLAEGYTNFTTPMKLYDKDATVTFIFADKYPPTNENLGLTEIGVAFKETQNLNFVLGKLQSSVNEANLSYIKKEANPSYMETNYPFNTIKLINTTLTESLRNSSIQETNSLLQEKNNEEANDVTSLDSISIYVNVESDKDNPTISSLGFLGRNAAMLYHDKK